MATESTMTLAEAARSLVAAGRRGALGTLHCDNGYPYGSVTDYAPLDNGDAVLLLSRLAEHRRFLEADERASLLVAPALGTRDTLALARVTLLGRCRQDSSHSDLRRRYLQYHPQAEVYVDFADFDFFRLQVEQVRYIAGFGRMDWLTGAAYRAAAVDPLAPAAADLVAHMNTDQIAVLRDYARGLLRRNWAAQVIMTGIDRYGFDLYCRGAEGQAEQVRLAFSQPVVDPASARRKLAELAVQARQAAPE